MTLQIAADLAQRFQVFDREEAALSQRSIQSRCCMALGQNQTIPILGVRILGIHIHIHEIEVAQYLSDIQTAARMTALCTVSSLDHTHPDMAGVFCQGKLFCICHDGPPV